MSEAVWEQWNIGSYLRRIENLATVSKSMMPQDRDQKGTTVGKALPSIDQQHMFVKQCVLRLSASVAPCSRTPLYSNEASILEEQETDNQVFLLMHSSEHLPWIIDCWE